MRVNRLSIFLHAVVLALANLALLFGLSALPTDTGPYLLVAFFLAAFAFFLAGSEHRWRFPWWGSVALAVLVLVLAFWLCQIDSDDGSLTYHRGRYLPLIYLFLTLQALLLVKLTGPKTPLDFWIEQGAGFVFVLFACGVCKNLWFSGLLLVYISAGVVAVLTQHFRDRQDMEPTCRGRVTVRALQPRRLEPTGVLRPRVVLLWGLVVVPVVLALFFCVPRPDLAFGQDDVGSFDDMDLNKSGRVRLGQQTAFTVAVTDGRPRPGHDLDMDQHWRCGVFTTYARGHWYSATSNRTQTIEPAWRLPNLAPGDRQFDFTVQLGQAGGLPLADPVAETPARLGYARAPAGYFPRLDVDTATFERYTVAKGGGPFAYTQVVPVGAAPDRTPAPDYDGADGTADRRRVPAGVRAYTIALLQELAAQNLYGLREDDYQGADDPAPGASMRGERVARALAEHLRSSHDFAYSLERPREDTSIDPTEDFLVNTRQGHCERFAGALALMLRSQGIPARVVVGYRGWYPQGGNVYAIRQNTAHAWVEALVPPQHDAFCAAAGVAGCEPWLNDRPPDWLSLDPTTSWAPLPKPPSAGWFSTFMSSLGSWWGGPSGGGGIHLNPINFDGRIQADFFSWAAANLPYLLVAALVLAVLLYLARFLRQWMGLPSAEERTIEPFYVRLLQLLAWHRGLEPQPAQTPLEFGMAVGQVLAAEPKTRGVAALPAWVVELYYRVRFGGRPLAAEERAAVEGRLEELKAGLKGK